MEVGPPNYFNDEELNKNRHFVSPNQALEVNHTLSRMPA